MWRDDYYSEYSPIFIIGAARSGTKFLRALLAESPSLVAVPYDISFVWRYGNEAHPDDCLPRVLATTKTKAFIRHNLIKMAGITRHNKNKFIIEKNSW